jgi:hypothetical protein
MGFADALANAKPPKRQGLLDKYVAALDIVDAAKRLTRSTFGGDITASKWTHEFVRCARRSAPTED